MSFGTNGIRRISLGTKELSTVSRFVFALWEGRPANVFLYEDYPGQGTSANWNTAVGTPPIGRGGFPGYFHYTTSGKESKFYSKTTASDDYPRVVMEVDTPGTVNLDLHLALKPTPLLGNDFNTYLYVIITASRWEIGLRDGNYDNGYYHFNLASGAWTLKKGDIITITKIGDTAKVSLNYTTSGGQYTGWMPAKGVGYRNFGITFRSGSTTFSKLYVQNI